MFVLTRAPAMSTRSCIGKAGAIAARSLIFAMLLSVAHLSHGQSIDELEVHLRHGETGRASQVLDALRQTAPPNQMRQRFDALDTIISIRAADLRFNAHADAFETGGRRADFNAAKAAYDFLTDRATALPEYPVSAEFKRYMDGRLEALRQRMDAIQKRRLEQIAEAQAAPREPVPPPIPADFFQPERPSPAPPALTCEEQNNGGLLRLERQTLMELNRLNHLSDQMRGQGEIEAVSGVANLQVRRVIGEHIVQQRRRVADVFSLYRSAGGKAVTPEAIAAVSVDPCRGAPR